MTMISLGIGAVTFLLVLLLLLINERTRRMQLAIQEFSKKVDRMQDLLSVMELLPLIEPAKRMQHNIQRVEEQMVQAREAYHRQELRELETFSAQKNSSQQPFQPSEMLVALQKKWADQASIYHVVSAWPETFQRVLTEFLNAQLSLEDAENALLLEVPFSSDEQVAESFRKHWSAEWKADRWQNHLQHLKHLAMHS